VIIITLNSCKLCINLSLCCLRLYKNFKEAVCAHFHWIPIKLLNLSYALYKMITLSDRIFNICTILLKFVFKSFDLIFLKMIYAMYLSRYAAINFFCQKY